MGETQLLIFRSGSETYGLPIEDVSGIIANARMDGLSIVGNVESTIDLQDKSIQISNVDVQSGEKKSAIIAHMNGVQILIIADEIIQERKLISTESEPNATIATLPIWKFTQGSTSRQSELK